MMVITYYQNMKKIINYSKVSLLQKRFPLFFKGAQEPRQMIKKHEIPDKYIVYYYINIDKKLIKSTHIYTKSDPYILKTYIEDVLAIEYKKIVSEKSKKKKLTKFIPTRTPPPIIVKQSNNPVVITPNTALKPKISSTIITIDKRIAINPTKSDRQKVNNIEILYNVPEIILDEREKFTIRGVKYNIKIRGKRSEVGILFNITDIGNMLNINKLYKDHIKGNINYVSGIEYKVIGFDNNRKGGMGFFTYNGLLKYIFTSRSDSAVYIQHSMIKILYITQFGSKEEREELSDEILGIPVKQSIEILQNTSPISCVYLYTLGYVKDLRISMKIVDKHKDDDIVCKIGLTCNLNRRSIEHNQKYKKIKNVKVALKHFQYIDTELLKEAEDYLKNYFKSNKLKYKKEQELVVISQTMMKDVIGMLYENIGNKCLLRCKNIVDKLKNMEKDIEMKEKNMKLTSSLVIIKADAKVSEANTKTNNVINELENIKKEMKMKDDFHKSELESKDKDIEFLKFKIEILKEKVQNTKL